MKHKFSSFWTFFAAMILTFLIAGCSHSVEIDASLLPGEWVSGTLHETYLSNGEGHTWDTADDVTEEEAQQFTWTLNGQDLTQYHQMEMGGTIPKSYTVTVLTPTTLKYHDDYDKEYTFSR